MSDVPPGPGWWLASDGRWYPPPQPGPVSGYPGQPGGGYGQPAWPIAATSGLAIASLVLSILWLGGIGSLLAIVFAAVALKQINESRGQKKGAGLAIAGLVIGCLGTVATLGFYYAAFELGRTVNSLLTPTQLQMGQTGTYTISGNEGMVSVAVLSVQFPFNTHGSFVQPSSGTEFATAWVRECTGSEPLAGLSSTSGWQLVFPDGAAVNPTIDAEQPGLDLDGTVGPYTCFEGYITFDIPSGSTPTSIKYAPFLVHPYEWTLPKAVA